MTRLRSFMYIRKIMVLTRSVLGGRPKVMIDM